MQAMRQTAAASQIFDVLVVGGGHAGLTAAICAAEQGARVCLLEGAPRAYRGGNSRHTRNLRVMHETPTGLLTGAYEEDEFWEDLLWVTAGKTREQLARMTIRESASSVHWLQQHGVHFQPALGGAMQLDRTNAFFLGGGKALVNALYRCAQRLGVCIQYDAPVTELDFAAARFKSAMVAGRSGQYSIRAKALVVAAGGFEANREWLAQAWGPVANNFLIRGTPYNRGKLLKILLANGVSQVGDARQCHAVAIDGRAPLFDGGIVTRVDCVSLGIVVNNRARRFYDEGENFWPKRYAIWGRLVAAESGQMAHVLVDSKTDGMYIPPVFPAETAGTIAELAVKSALDPARLQHTVDEYNAAVVPGTFDHQVLDNCHTKNLRINKSHWARPLDTPPYKAYLLRPGITFTYLGVKIDHQARVLLADDKPAATIFAAGEIMAGNVLGQGYLAGTGMTIGSVFGRLAGKEAAAYACK